MGKDSSWRIALMLQGGNLPWVLRFGGALDRHRKAAST